MEWSWIIDDVPTTVTIELRADGNDTVLNLEHRDIPAGTRAHFEPGWHDMSGGQAGGNGALIVANSVTRILPGVVPTTLVHGIDLAISGNEFLAITGPV